MSTYYSELSVPKRYYGYIQKFWTLNNMQHPFYTPYWKSSLHAMLSATCLGYDRRRFFDYAQTLKL
ncbi:hypothetical protein [Pedobacter jeongneungensis]|uniref:hypothetical protein n=1 Tax=Pedobacter jeongneungensis TaxID=947309 RepID=UPI0031D6BF93